jgi:hypothetical protein
VGLGVSLGKGCPSDGEDVGVGYGIPLAVVCQELKGTSYAGWSMRVA